MAIHVPNIRCSRKFVLEHYFAWKSFANVQEFSSAYPGKEILNKTRARWLELHFGTWKMSVFRKVADNAVKLFCKLYLRNKSI